MFLKVHWLMFNNPVCIEIHEFISMNFILGVSTIFDIINTDEVCGACREVSQGTIQLT